jgi:hypothetical protein
MAGAGGIEPPNAGTKNRCLTAWRRPKTLDDAESTPKVGQKATPLKGAKSL